MRDDLATSMKITMDSAIPLKRTDTRTRACKSMHRHVGRSVLGAQPAKEKRASTEAGGVGRAAAIQ